MISVCFYRPKNPWARLQTWWTGGAFSHCSLHFVLDGVPVFAHSLPSYGVTLTPAARGHDPDVVYQQPWIPDAAVIPWILQQLGIKYGWLDAAEFVIPGNSNKPGLTCSEFIADFLLLADARFGPTPQSDAIGRLRGDTSRVLPSDLAALLATP